MAFTGSRLNPTEQPWDTTNYTHASDPNLSEVHRSLQYNSAGQPELRTSNFILDVSRGAVPGHSIVFLTGINRSLAANSDETIWNGSSLYPWTTWDADGAVTIHVGSSSTSDAGKTILVNGLDNNFAIQTEVITLPSTNTATTTKLFRRVNNIVQLTGAANVGTVNARYSTALGTIVAQMAPGTGLSCGSYYTVPLGYTAFSVYGDFSCSKNEGCELRVFWRVGGIGPFLNIYTTQVYAGHAVATPPYSGAIPEKTDIDNRAGYSTNSGITITSNQQLLLIDNTYL